MKLLVLPLLIVPFACVTPVLEPGADECEAGLYAGLIGDNIAAVTLPNSPEIRAYGVDDMVTQDFVPGRTNIVYDETGTIIRVFCG